MKLKTLVETKKQNILDTAARYGAYNIRIFGSVARGDDDEHSDVDFLVETNLNYSWFNGVCK